MFDEVMAAAVFNFFSIIPGGHLTTCYGPHAICPGSSHDLWDAFCEKKKIQINMKKAGDDPRLSIMCMDRAFEAIDH